MQNPTEMSQQASSQQDQAHRFLAAPEIFLVALAAPLLIQIIFLITDRNVLGSSYSVVLFMVTEATLTLVLIVCCLHFRGETLLQLGWVWRNIRTESGLGIVCVPFLFFSTMCVNIFFHAFYPEYVSTTNPLLDLVDEPNDLTLFLISSVYVGGIKEEIQRAFVLDRFERYLGPMLLRPFLYFTNRPNCDDEAMGRRLGVVIGLILWSIFFAIGHAVQGFDRAVGAGILGLLFGALYLWRRNFIAPMVAHALFDVTTLLVVWFFY